MHLLQILPMIVLLTIFQSASKCFTFKYSSHTPSFFNDCAKLATSALYTFKKKFEQNIPLCNPITIILQCILLIMCTFRLNCIFNEFDKKMINNRRNACNLDTWKTFLIQISLIFPFTITVTIMESIPIALIIQIDIV